MLSDLSRLQIWYQHDSNYILIVIVNDLQIKLAGGLFWSFSHWKSLNITLEVHPFQEDPLWNHALQSTQKDQLKSLDSWSDIQFEEGKLAIINFMSSIVLG
jgi:hypothetical protein